MPPEVCADCPDKARCPVKQTRNGCYFEHTAKQRRLDQRRRNEKIDEFRECYKKRAGIESTNSGVKRRTGMARLRVRGKKSVFHAIILKIAGWNVFQAARAKKMRQHVAEQMGKQTPEGQNAEVPHAMDRRLRLLTAHTRLENAVSTQNKAACSQISGHRLLCAA